jgi:hypothetical protein
VCAVLSVLASIFFIAEKFLHLHILDGFSSVYFFPGALNCDMMRLGNLFPPLELV